MDVKWNGPLLHTAVVHGFSCNQKLKFISRLNQLLICCITFHSHSGKEKQKMGLQSMRRKTVSQKVVCTRQRPGLSQTCTETEHEMWRS